MIKLAIGGKLQTGKNTASEIIIKQLGLLNDQVKSVAFADPLKKTVEAAFPEASSKALYGASELRSTIISSKYKDEEGNPLTHRKALTTFGTVLRQFNDNIFIFHMANKLKSADENCKLFIITDLRFITEFNFLKETGFFITRIKRDNVFKINDKSETELDSIPDDAFDFMIDNNQDLANLEKQCEKMLNSEKIIKQYINNTNILG